MISMDNEYQKFAASYDEQLKDAATKAMYVEWKNELEAALKKYTVRSGTLFDLGCGTGITTLPWVEKFKHVLGVELSSSMLAEARKKSSRIEWVQQNIVNLKLEKKADVVTCHFDVLNHILEKSDLQKVFDNVFTVLNNNGLFIFDLMSPESFDWLEKQGKKSDINERPYSIEEMKEIACSSGFAVLWIKKQKTPEWDGKPNRFIFLLQKK
jgi:ubiquinone/menaquinone biosynthesis C-methylase UbiE